MDQARFLSIFPSMLVLIGLAGSVDAQDAAAFCKAGQSDRSERPTPEALLPRVGKVFGVEPRILRGASFVRCAGGHLMACAVGANRDCGRADVSRHSVGGDAFCHDNPGAAVVPMAATGHDTIFAWHCSGAHAVAGGTVAKVGASGFMSGNWRRLR